MAEWLGNGLQNRLHRFDSGRRLHATNAQHWAFFIYVRATKALPMHNHHDGQLAFRPVETADAHALITDCWSDRTLLRAIHIIDRMQRFVEQGRGHGIVVTHANRLIAYGQVTRWSRSAEISDLYVSAHYRSYGVGSALIQHLMHLAGKLDADCVEIGASKHNPRAIALYRRLGFVDAYEVTLNLGRGAELVLYMRQQLADDSQDGR